VRVHVRDPLLGALQDHVFTGRACST
jgi:hypothetical protein